ncbi:Alkaline nuclease [Frankliniella fusca]|uniref:Alkaline nuclease n=1 Tax=Frankliniella fusca TaxID=407009 RepID=A0AAE1I0Y8_9NEOP|nr:Alkaline nuclease [Frankliniella fusca]
MQPLGFKKIDFRKMSVTCTGRECYWNKAPRPKNPGIIKEKGDYYPKRDTERRATFDPRAKRFQNEDVDIVARLLSLLKTSQDTKSLWSLQLKTAAKKYEFNTPIVISDPIFADLIVDNYDGPPRDTETVKVQCSIFFWLMHWVRNYHRTTLELQNTRGQTENGFWYSERCVRVTASVAKQVLGLTSPEAKMNFLRKHMWGLDKFESPGMIYGKESEPIAREEYIKEIRKEDPQATVREMGTCINPDFPQLSCSPDGLLFSEVLGDRLLEIKCPVVLAEGDPNHFEQFLHQKQKWNFFLKRNKHGSLELKKTSQYYYQIQMSMAILNLTLCDFVVWSKNGMVKLTINFDMSFWQEKKKRLMAIHRSLFVPEHFFMRTPRFLLPQELTYPEFHEDHEDVYFVNHVEGDM